MLESESGIMYTGIYRATVIKQESHGKLKLYIYGVTPKPIEEYYNNDVLVSDLPFAEPAMSLFGGTGTTNGFISYPHVGATVWCFFENYDYMRPVYFATCPAGEEYEKTYNKVCQKELNQTNDFGVHRLVINNNILTFEEDSHVILEVIDKDDPSKFTTVDILPNTTDILITNGTAYTHINAIPDKSDIIIQNPQTLTQVIAIPGAVELTTDNIQVNATKSTTINSPAIELNSSTTTINSVATTINGTTTINGLTNINGITNINGLTNILPDAIIGGKSFIDHKHTCTITGITTPPLPI